MRKAVLLVLILASVVLSGCASTSGLPAAFPPLESGPASGNSSSKGVSSASPQPYAGETLTLGTTTTTRDSGLLDVLLPAFENDTGIHVRPMIGGSGEIIAKASHGDVDALLSHSKGAEVAFVAGGDGIARVPVMYNRFFLVGPPSDPAGAGSAPNASLAFKRVYDNRTINGVSFASRGDQSGTDVKEKSIWASLGTNASAFDVAWYKQTGSGQSQTLLFANEKGAYAMSDEATWAQMKANGQLSHLSIVFQNDTNAFKNQYGVIIVNATKHPGVRQDLALVFQQWVTGPRGQEVEASYRIGGQQVFFPDATDPRA